MIMIRIIVLLLVFSASAIYAQSDKAVAEVLSLHKKKFEWLINKNYDSLTAVLDDELMYIHSNGWIETRSQVLDDLKTGVITYTKSEVIESKVRMFGNSAVITGKGAFAGTARGNAFELNLLYTEVYSRVSGKWKLVSRHACRI